MVFNFAVTFAGPIRPAQHRALLYAAERLKHFPHISVRLLFSQHAHKQLPVFWGEGGRQDWREQRRTVHVGLRRQGKVFYEIIIRYINEKQNGGRNAPDRHQSAVTRAAQQTNSIWPWLKCLSPTEKQLRLSLKDQTRNVSECWNPSTTNRHVFTFLHIILLHTETLGELQIPSVTQSWCQYLSLIYIQL